MLIFFNGLFLNLFTHQETLVKNNKYARIFGASPYDCIALLTMYYIIAKVFLMHKQNNWQKDKNQKQHHNEIFGKFIKELMRSDPPSRNMRTVIKILEPKTQLRNI